MSSTLTGDQRTLSLVFIYSKRDLHAHTREKDTETKRESLRGARKVLQHHAGAREIDLTQSGLNLS